MENYLPKKLRNRKKALLALADGAFFEGWSFGAEGEACGEVVFNTSMTGYPEILTDPSYKGQLVTMTYPLMGNYGINLDEDRESFKPHLEGFIVKEPSIYPSNWRSRGTLEEFLKENNIVGIQGIDTRALTRHLRDFGSQMAYISTKESDPEALAHKAGGLHKLEGLDLVKEVTCQRPYEWQAGEACSEPVEGKVSKATASVSKSTNGFHVVAYDCGVKFNILRKLVNLGVKVTVVPASTEAATVLGMSPDGILVSNGPGDPAAVTYTIENIKQLMGKKPIFGICLGHQLLALALGLKTYKLKFGHHGANHPVMDLSTGKVEITTQNHCFAVEGWEGWRDTPYGPVELTHINLNDRSVEGLRLKDLPVFSVQYHPEASPGPHDAGYLFERFLGMVKAYRKS